MNFKKFTAFAVSLSMLTALTACGTTEPAQPEAPEAPETIELTAEQYTTVYTDALASLELEMLEYNPVMSNIEEYDEFMLQVMGLTADMLEASAISISMMNTQAYGLAMIHPTEGNEQAVADGLTSFVELQKSNFEMYLVDQFEIAEQGIVETLEDGTVIMVICEDSQTARDTLADAVTAALTAE